MTLASTYTVSIKSKVGSMKLGDFNAHIFSILNRQYHINRHSTFRIYDDDYNDADDDDDNNDDDDDDDDVCIKIVRKL